MWMFILGSFELKMNIKWTCGIVLAFKKCTREKSPGNNRGFWKKNTSKREIWGELCESFFASQQFYTRVIILPLLAHWVTKSLTESLWKLYLVILVEELPNRNCFGIDSVIFCVEWNFGPPLRSWLPKSQEQRISPKRPDVPADIRPKFSVMPSGKPCFSWLHNAIKNRIFETSKLVLYD